MKAAAGFTLLELVLAAALTTVLATAGLGAVSRSKQREDLLSVVSRIAQELQLAQERSIAGYKDTGWKVSLSETQVILTDADGNNQEVYRWPAGSRLSHGGISAINFSRPGGFAQECPGGCQFQLVGANGAVSYEFRVLYSGTVEY